MSAAASLRAALADAYHHSVRLVLLNCAIGVVVVASAAAAAFVLPAVLLVLVAGPLVAALVHCAVVVARTGDLEWADAHEGLRLHWRRGLALGALGAAGVGLGVLAIRFYAQHGLWPVAALSAYLLAMFCVWQLVAWPLAVTGVERPLAGAARELLRRPRAALGFGIVLVVLNTIGAVAIIPILTLTLAYSFLAAAHFVLPPQEA